MRPGIASGLLAFVATLALAACSATTTPPPSTGSGPGRPVSVVTTTTVFADMIRQVGGANVAVTSLVPKGGDVHTFEPQAGRRPDGRRARSSS